MNQNLIYFPCLAMLFLTFFVLLRMFVLRMAAVKNGEVDMKHFKTYNLCTKLPFLMLQAERNFTNLFEVPVLFYMTCAFTLMTAHVDALMLSLAWSYVLFRILHSIVHLTSNKLVYRMSLYGMSWIILTVMATTLGFRLL